jgi:hypothetical protein
LRGSITAADEIVKAILGTDRPPSGAKLSQPVNRHFEQFTKVFDRPHARERIGLLQMRL